MASFFSGRSFLWIAGTVAIVCVSQPGWAQQANCIKQNLRNAGAASLDAQNDAANGKIVKTRAAHSDQPEKTSDQLKGNADSKNALIQQIQPGALSFLGLLGTISGNATQRNTTSGDDQGCKIFKCGQAQCQDPSPWQSQSFMSTSRS